jgi:TRAP-type C4-dicarboxylate transport system permease large subunit
VGEDGRGEEQGPAQDHHLKVYKGTSILMIALVLTTALVMVFPQIVLWLPNTMR